MKHFLGGFWRMKTANRRFGALGVAVALLLVLGTVAQPATAAAESALTQRAVSEPQGATAAPIDNEVAVATVEIATVVIDEGAKAATVALAINPGPTPIAAFQLELVYDGEALTATGCDHVTGFGVCAPKSDGHLELNAARIESWTTRTEVVHVSFDVRASSALRIGKVTGVWGDESSGMNKVAYDLAFGAIHVGEPEPDNAEEHRSAVLDGKASLTGTASAGVQNSGLYGAGVCVMHEVSHAARCTITNNRGEYRIDGLPAGAYTVEYVSVDDDDASRRLHGVVVAESGTTQGVDFDLRMPADGADNDEGDVAAAASAQGARGASDADAVVQARRQDQIAGAVSHAGEPVAAVLICAREVGIGTEICAASGFDGTYALDGLYAGNYVVSVSDPGQRFADTQTRAFGFEANAAKQLDFDLTSR